MKQFLVAVLLTLSAPLHCSAHLHQIPYDSNTDRQRLAHDLGLEEGSIALDQRCMVSHSKEWQPSLPLKAFDTCVLVVTRDALILATTDLSSGTFKPMNTYRFSDILDVAVEQEGSDKPIDAGGVKEQLQFSTADGFISVTAFRTAKGVRPIDSRGAEDAYRLLVDGGVKTTPSKGKVDMTHVYMWGW